MKKLRQTFWASAVLLAFSSCSSKDEVQPTPPSLVFKFRFDPTQERLNNVGLPSSIPAGNAAQSPRFNSISAHYFELAPTMFTQLTEGEILYRAPETTAGGDNAIDFSKSVVVAPEEIALSVPLSSIKPGTYDYLRVSLAYQNYDVDFKYETFDLTGTVASFIGFNTYISSYKIKDQTVDINANKLQGHWGFETDFGVTTGDAPGTTVPNPINDSSPIPPGSCVVTGPFSSALTITGTETEDIVVIISLSNNNSFEWTDGNANGIWEPALGETVVDMGIRGMIPIVQ